MLKIENDMVVACDDNGVIERIIAEAGEYEKAVKEAETEYDPIVPFVIKEAADDAAIVIFLDIKLKLDLQKFTIYRSDQMVTSVKYTELSIYTPKKLTFIFIRQMVSFAHGLVTNAADIYDSFDK